MNKLVELRIRSGTRPGFRMEIGVAKSKTQLGDLYRLRDLLRRLHGRGEFDVLDAAKDGRTTPAELERLVDSYGMEDYRKHLNIEPPRPAFEVPTLDAHVLQWLDTIPKSGTRKVYSGALAHLRDFELDGARLGDRPWHLAAPRHVIRDVKTRRRQEIAGNTLRTVMGAWSAFFEWAIARDESEAAHKGRPRLLEMNPVRAAKIWDPIEITRHRFLSWDEFQQLLRVSPAAMRPQYATLALTGLRIDELMTLPPAHMTPGSHLHVGPWGTWVPKGYPRSRRGVRDVPLHHDLIPLIDLYAELYAGTETFFVNPENGAPWAHKSFGRRLSKDVKAAGMIFGQWTRPEGELTRKPEGITAHTLRHTFASWLAQRDVQLQKIAILMGDTVETVARHYSHLLPSDLDRSVNRIGAAESGIASGENAA